MKKEDELVEEIREFMAAVLERLDQLINRGPIPSAIPPRMPPKDVAKLLNCSHSQVIALIRSGKLRAINIGAGTRDRYVVDPAEIERFEKGQDAVKPTLRRPRKTKVADHLGLYEASRRKSRCPPRTSLLFTPFSLSATLSERIRLLA